MPFNSADRCRWWCGGNGFTLLELVVVIAIMGMVLLLAPTVTAALPGFRLHAAAAQLADTLRGLRDQAIRGGIQTTLALNYAARTYRLSGSEAVYYIPEVVDKVQVDSDSPLINGGILAVRFFPDGSARGATIILSHGSRHEAVSIDWLTGRVRNDA